VNDTDARTVKKETVADILERNLDSTIESWMSSVERNEELTSLSLNYQERTGYLPLLLDDLVGRLRLAPDAKVTVSSAARKHGILRHAQGYTVPMIVEEFRILQVSIFITLHNNLGNVDLRIVMLDVATIADEMDSQLKQAMLAFLEPLGTKSASLSA
jgi:hypothetical protein